MYTQSEQAWRTEAIEKIKASGQGFGSDVIKSLNLIEEFKKRFGREIGMKEITNWLAYYYKKMTSPEERITSGSKHRGGWRERHTEEEMTWAESARQKIMSTGYVIGTKVVREMDLPGEFQGKFGKEISIGALVFWLKALERKALGGELPKSRRDKTGPQGPAFSAESLLDPEVNCLLVANGIIVPFPSREKVAQFIKDTAGQTPFIGGVKMFEAVPLNVEHDIKVSIGDQAKTTV